MQKTTFARIPGLFFYAGFFDAAECVSLLRDSLAMHERLEARLAPEEPLRQASIPQPAFVRSSKHNLQSEERYARLSLDEPDGRAIRCEYFPRYGEDGHALCYFQGNANLPGFVGAGLIERVRRAIEADGLAAEGQSLLWKLTMNFYKSRDGTLAGFPFHVDIPSNGVVTMILNIQREALFQIARGDECQDLELPVGCVLLLSGESRYEWKHRVLPKPLGTDAVPGKVQRVSLVLGYQ